MKDATPLYSAFTVLQKAKPSPTKQYTTPLYSVLKKAKPSPTKQYLTKHYITILGNALRYFATLDPASLRYEKHYEKPSFTMLHATMRRKTLLRIT